MQPLDILMSTIPKTGEVIILRNEEKMDIEYEDTYHIKEMRKLVHDYNELFVRHL